jgi:nucleoside-diphosphate-sugar epimerase
VKILVTGGTGFLGSHLGRALLQQGQTVYILGRDFTPVANLLAAGAHQVSADLRDARAIERACAGMDAVFHVGALSAAWGKRADFHAINAGGTQAVVAGCRQHRVDRLIYVSSPAVTFDGNVQVNITESAPYPRHFTSTYALTKKLGEDAVATAFADGLAAVIIRPKAIFGPGDRALLPRLLAAARQGRLRQFGNGQNQVDLTYVDNVVHALLLALDSQRAIGHTYVITNDEHIPLWPTIRRVLVQAGVPSALHPLPLPVALVVAHLMETQAAITGREPLLTRYSVGILARTQTYNIAAARRDLGYAPVVSVAEGIERTLPALRQK